MPECGFRRLEPSKITVGASIANRCVEVKTEWLMLQGLRQLGTSPSRALSVVDLSEPEPWAAAFIDEACRNETRKQTIRGHAGAL